MEGDSIDFGDSPAPLASTEPSEGPIQPLEEGRIKDSSSKGTGHVAGELTSVSE